MRAWRFDPSGTFIKGRMTILPHSAFDKGPARIETSDPHFLDIYGTFWSF